MHVIHIVAHARVGAGRGPGAGRTHARTLGQAGGSSGGSGVQLRVVEAGAPNASRMGGRGLRGKRAR